MTDLATLLSCLSRNRFMPVPPPELHYVGDGDYQAIGAEFLGHLIQHAGLKPNDRILDIGSGVGRLAMPLTQYLQEGTYDGIDPVLSGVKWCQEHVTSVYGNTRFHHVNMQHELYNPQGEISTDHVRLPFEDGSFDVICLISVLTHLRHPAILQYASEISRLLAPGGRCFATAFLMNSPARAALEAGRGMVAFNAGQDGPTYFAFPDAPLAAVGFEEDFLLELFLRHGLQRRSPGSYGNWSGRAGRSFQDICIFEKETH